MHLTPRSHRIVTARPRSSARRCARRVPTAVCRPLCAARRCDACLLTAAVSAPVMCGRSCRGPREDPCAHPGRALKPVRSCRACSGASPRGRLPGTSPCGRRRKSGTHRAQRTSHGREFSDLLIHILRTENVTWRKTRFRGGSRAAEAPTGHGRYPESQPGSCTGHKPELYGEQKSAQKAAANARTRPGRPRNRSSAPGRVRRRADRRRHGRTGPAPPDDSPAGDMPNTHERAGRSRPAAGGTGRRGPDGSRRTPLPAG